MKYLKKSDTFEAWQYDPESLRQKIELPGWLLQALKDGSVGFRDETTATVETEAFGSVGCEENSWIVYREGGGLSVYSAEDFDRKFFTAND